MLKPYIYIIAFFFTYHLLFTLLFTCRGDCFDEETRLRRCGEDFKQHVEGLNNICKESLHNHLNSAIENCIAGMRYFRVQDDGPHIREVSAKSPLIDRYL